MKYLVRILLGWAVSAGAIASAQTYNTPIRHVIVVMQENRTPDNLFQDPALIANGADISSTGFLKNDQGQRVTIQLVPGPLDSCYGPAHTHGAWLQMWDNGAMDGADRTFVNFVGCTSITMLPRYPQFTYVRNTLFDGVHGILDPYYQLAEQ